MNKPDNFLADDQLIFSLPKVLHDLKHYLPSQTPLKDFIHHNSLHAFQDQRFYEAIFRAAKIFGYQVTFHLHEYRQLFAIRRIKPEVLARVIKERKGSDNYSAWLNKVLEKEYDDLVKPRIGNLRANWKNIYAIDLENLIQPLLFRIIGSYLDQGIALWHFPFENDGLLNAIRKLEKNSFTSFFKNQRAKDLLFNPETSIESLLDLLVGDPLYYEQYLFDQQFSHRGWSGMVATIEENPSCLLYQKKVSLSDFIILELLLEIDALDTEFAQGWLPLAKKTKLAKPVLFEPTPLTELHEVLMIWQDAFEWSYYDEILFSVQQLKKIKEKNDQSASVQKKSFQAIFCIDERECSIRRHLEDSDPNCETLGCPGFFGVEFYFHPAKGKFYEKLCPAPVTPNYLIKEKENDLERHREIIHSKKTHSLVRGFFSSFLLGFYSLGKLFSGIFNPQMRPDISNSFAHMHLESELIIENTDPENRENELQVGFTVAEMSQRVEGLLRGIGLVENFSPLIYLIAHGSSSANNPHHGAYDCGACSGRPGSVNARVFAFMANHREVRKNLAKAGIVIPEETQFIGSMHDTASDEIAFYDEKDLSPANISRHRHNRKIFETALDLNAKERSRRFASINTKADLKKVRKEIKKRSVSYFEPRPELGHGTNSLCFVGNRELTKGLFLDRRAFMNSYDYRTDPDGTFLINVIKPLPPVCGGINLEYYFSRMDNYKLGAGTKLPHNVMGLIGVANSSDGDLRPGLSLQMIEVHDPIRLLIVVEHYPEVILATIKKIPELYAWFTEEWVHLISINPADQQFYFFKNGQFQVYQPVTISIGETNNVKQLIEQAKEMPSNYILDATQENIPVHIINKN